MKRHLLFLLLPILLLPLFTACKNLDYNAYISDERSDIFCAETEEYSVVVSCVDREHPFLTDGIVGTRTKTVEVTLTEKEPTGSEYEIYFLEDMPRGGEMSFRSVSGDFYYSRGVEEFPSGSISLRILRDGTPTEIAATSIKNEKTLSTSEALQFAIEAEKSEIERLTNGGFAGEFHVRLLRRDKNYYYIGIVDRDGKTVSLLLDAETGAVLARRERQF